MRSAGYEVRVLVAEDESWEENPPSLPDFIRREILWCQGNMQYWSLLAKPGLSLLGRIQLGLAIMMYVSPVAWMTFIFLGLAQVTLQTPGTYYPALLGIILFAAIMAMSLMPKLMGLASTLVQARERRRYGGAPLVVAGGLLEIVFSALTAPVVGFAIAVFVIGLMFGRKIDWRVQQREAHTVRWSEAALSFWPQTLAGVVMTLVLLNYAPQVLPWAAPVIAGFLLSVPFAVATSSQWASQLSVRMGLCDIPEDRRPPLPLRRLLGEAEVSRLAPEISGIKQAS
jgi:membrane glycosyltransferase